jgi:hypothetical protein
MTLYFLYDTVNSEQYVNIILEPFFEKWAEGKSCDFQQDNATRHRTKN